MSHLRGMALASLLREAAEDAENSSITNDTMIEGLSTIRLIIFNQL
jgi:hypothetical protein